MQSKNTNRHIGKRNVFIVLLSVVFALIACYPVFLNITKNALAVYLTVNKPVSNARILIVEGWLFDNLIPDVKREFVGGRYDYILIAWQPKAAESNNHLPAKPENDRVEVYRRLIALGLDSSKIRIASFPIANVHNTLAMALAVKKWLREKDSTVIRVNICSANVHGRKTWVAYKRVLGKSFAVGIISFSRRNIPVSQWWKKSPGGGLRWLLLRWAGVIDAAWWPLSWLDAK